ncbi:cytidyltransferase-related domain protein [Pyrobaculum islandicum DSM 4184]|uniref:Nicotinamide-nucleotide adenylyltransferase n=1 Tax=Pyrobaculum islandicum (strain DSM 4184 / JCM 9189 / GEO3) TaxID=384616 RepID=A1RSZ2_PYRIL|nr:nicotinamide-nucleotide adenylyltransferase [Pyrobaculum islandicum]ABL88074.1 cytidyltransferase-related domain protein [Pyrobaculum islandicum DSM 4184]
MRALFIGRFQPLHWGHVKVVEWLLTHYDEVIVAVGSADKAFTQDNPFTPGERLEMFRRHFGANCRLLYCTVPDTGGSSSLWGAYLRHWCPPHHVVYSNNPWVVATLKHWNIDVRSHPQFGNYSATVVRQLMSQGDKKWRDLVPPAVAEYIDEIGGVERVQLLYGKVYKDGR